MRHTLDESPHAGDLELIGMLPAELRRLCLAWKALDFSAGPGTSNTVGSRHGSGEAPIPDQHREALRRYRNTKRMAIGRLADEIEKRVREVKRCDKCGAENSWQDVYCGESFPVGEKGCGALFQNAPARTRAADA